MSVISVGEILDDRSGSIDHKLIRLLSRSFQVLCSSEADDAVTVLSAGALPALFDSHPSYPGAIVVNRSAKQTDMGGDGGAKWVVSIKYSSNPWDKPSASATPDAQNPDPTLRPPVFKFEFRKMRWTPFKDRDGLPYVNSAGQPFQSGREIDVTLTTMLVSTYHATLPFAYFDEITDAVNNIEWYGCDPYTLKIDSFNAEIVIENNIQCWKYDWVIQKAPKVMGGVWYPDLILDQGYYENLQVSAGPPQYKEITGVNGMPISGASLLDGSGRKLGTGAAPVWLEFKTYALHSYDGIP